MSCDWCVSRWNTLRQTAWSLINNAKDSHALSLNKKKEEWVGRPLIAYAQKNCWGISQCPLTSSQFQNQSEWKGLEDASWNPVCSFFFFCCCYTVFLHCLDSANTQSQRLRDFLLIQTVMWRGGWLRKAKVFLGFIVALRAPTITFATRIETESWILPLHLGDDI